MDNTPERKRSLCKIFRSEFNGIDYFLYTDQINTDISLNKIYNTGNKPIGIYTSIKGAAEGEWLILEQIES